VVARLVPSGSPNPVRWVDVVVARPTGPCMLGEQYRLAPVAWIATRSGETRSATVMPAVTAAAGIE
jgi:hypothetical protein